MKMRAIYPILFLTTLFVTLSASLALDKSVFGAEVMSIEVPATPSDINLVVEQSSDLVNWTIVTPGTFNGSTQKRFFRLRAVEK
jgi:hypothetical protein